MRPFIVALFTWLPNILCDPTLEDNKLPTDQEVLTDLMNRQGQPEEEASLGLPTDEESFNELKSFLLTNTGSGGGVGGGSGTHHFVSAAFPEVDARGFHESVFNGLGDYFTSWPRKRAMSDDVYSEPMTNEDLGIFHPFRDRPGTRMVNYERLPTSNGAYPSLSRGKRQLPSLVQSCSLPGITCDPISQETSGEAETTPIPTSTTMPRQGPETETNSSTAETTITAARPTTFELMLPISTRHLVKRSIKSSTSGRTNGLDPVVSGKNHVNPNLNSNVLNRFIKERGDLSIGKGDRMAAVDTMLSKILAQLKTRKHLKRLLHKWKPVTTSSGLHTGFTGRDIMKRKPEMSSSGFHGDTFSGGFGDFDVMKRKPEMTSSGFHGDTFHGGFGDFDIMKRKPEMSSSGFHGDTFSGGFGDFDIMKRKPEMSSSGFHGDTFSGGFGDFDVMKRKPEMSSSGFHGDTFSGGFGDFDIMKRKPEMSSSGFHGDTFSGGFGDFDIMKRRPDMTSGGFHPDTFSGGFGEFDVMKRKPEMSSSGFHGDTFNGGFGDFDVMKRKPEMTASGFHGDTFDGGFADFDVMKREINPLDFNKSKVILKGKTAHTSKNDHISHKPINSNHENSETNINLNDKESRSQS